MNTRKTSKSVASKAARTLRSKSASATQKRLAASALSQASKAHATGKRMERLAATVLNGKNMPAKQKLLQEACCRSLMENDKAVRL